MQGGKTEVSQVNLEEVRGKWDSEGDEARGLELCPLSN